MSNSNRHEIDNITELQCPICRQVLVQGGMEWTCASEHVFPVINDIPILINDGRSVFAVSDYARPSKQTPSSQSRLKDVLSPRLPRLSQNETGPANYAAFGEILGSTFGNAKVLVVGGRTIGIGMKKLYTDPRFSFVETDLQFGPQVQVICDAHDLPFADESFDGVIIQAVLEHVADPPRCVEEIHRVLKDGGVVYAETPFMQQVHGGPYDFTRYTHLGHRRLFRSFDEVSSGPIGGPGMALAWSYRAFLKSWTSNSLVLGGMEILARLTGFWLKYCDRILMGKSSAFDYGWAYWFLGTKASIPLSDRDLIQQYRGGQ